MNKAAAIALVQRQLDAYNAKDVEALLTIYAEDAAITDLQGQLLRQGQVALRAAFVERFAEPDLHARLLHRHAMAQADGSWLVIDLESIRRNQPGDGQVEMLCCYTVKDGRIVRASFASSPWEALA